MKQAIVTGGSSGIGAGVVEMLLCKGYHVYTNYAHDDTRAKAFKERMSLISNDLTIYKTNLSSTDQVDGMLSEIKANAQQINCIVCNAGVTVRKNAFETSDQDMIDAYAVNVVSHFHIIKSLRDMLADDARIIFTGSMLAEMPHATSLAYGVSKAAVHALAKNLVKSFEGTQVTVNVVAPGFVETDWQKEKPTEIRKNICSKTALHRFAEISEIVKAFEFCLENDFLNGSVINVNGGYCFK